LRVERFAARPQPELVGDGAVHPASAAPN
jgi:hypothetical protein